MRFPGLPPKPTWWQKQKKRLAYWWRRTRSRIACWILGIDHFDIKMKGTIKNWETNIQGLYLTLDGNIDLMEEGSTFTHNEGTVTIDTLSVGNIELPTYSPTITTIGDVVFAEGGTFTCECGESWPTDEDHEHNCKGGRVDG